MIGYNGGRQVAYRRYIRERARASGTEIRGGSRVRHRHSIRYISRARHRRATKSIDSDARSGRRIFSGNPAPGIPTETYVRAYYVRVHGEQEGRDGRSLDGQATISSPPGFFTIAERVRTRGTAGICSARVYARTHARRAMCSRTRAYTTSPRSFLRVHGKGNEFARIPRRVTTRVRASDPPVHPRIRSAVRRVSRASKESVAFGE